MGSVLAEASAPWWPIGWDALVAVGTLGLAVGTAWMAWGTKNLAKETTAVANHTREVAEQTRALAQESAAERQAQWRPVLLPAPDVAKKVETTMTFGLTEGTLRIPPPHSIEYRGKVLRVLIHNSGRGPALHVRAELELGKGTRIGAREWSRGAVGAGDHTWLIFEDAQLGPHAQLLLDYRDIANKAHSTTCTIINLPDVARSYDARVFENLPVTNQRDAVYPPDGLTDVSAPKVSLRRDTA